MAPGDRVTSPPYAARYPIFPRHSELAIVDVRRAHHELPILVPQLV